MKGKKKAFLLSFLSLLMCVSMFIGTTFAWFTDSASSGVNTIVAGNLDIEVEYNELRGDGSLSGTWTDLQGSDSLFSRGLWEPGHTEYAVIRIDNAGTLALKYQVRVDVVSETGSINVAGRQFKLSDYLKYGVEYDTDVPSINRVGAVAMAGTNVGAYVSDTRILAAGAGYDYMVLAITMPETVGNEANYDKQYNAPSIDLGITVLATQTTSESDSFGDDYDQNAQYPIPTFTTSTSVVFPVKNEATLAQGATEVTVALTANTTTSETPVSLGSVKVPAGRVADDTKPVVVEVKPATQGNFGATSEGKETKYYEITVSNLTTNTADGSITVELQLDKGLTDVVIKHDKGGIPAVIDTIIPDSYDGATGIVKFKTTSFSPYAVEYKSEKVAEVGGVYYSSLVDAVIAAESNATIKLLKDAVGGGVKIKAANAKNFTIDFNGYTYTIDRNLVGSTGYESQAFHLEKGCNITLKNGTLTSTNASMIIQNYCNLTLDNMTIDGTNSSACTYVVSNNNGDVTITGNTNIYASEGLVAFDAYYWPKNGYTDGVRVTIDENMTGIISGKIEFTDDGTDSTGAANPAKHSIVIKGGTFTEDPSDFVASNCFVYEENGKYVVRDYFMITTAGDLVAFAEEVNGGNAFSGKTVKLMADIDLAGMAWTPIGGSGSIASYPGFTFKGTFDGNNKTISNMTVNVTGSWASAGLFGSANRATIKNVIIDKADIHSNHYAGGILGYDTETTVVSNCHVKNSTIVSSTENSTGNWDNGDKVGGIVGYMNVADISGCTVTNTSVQGYRDLGGIAGYIGGGTVSDCKISDVTITIDNTHNYKNYTGATAHDANSIVGENNGTIEDCTGEATIVGPVVIVSTADELSAALTATYSANTIIKLANDIDLSGFTWNAHVITLKNSAKLIIDGNNKTITGLNVTDTVNQNGFVSNGLIASIARDSDCTLTFINLTVSGATIANDVAWNSVAGVFVGDAQSIALNFENCKIENANVTSVAYAAGFVGYYANHTEATTNKVTISDCTVTGSTFSGNDATGALVALNNFATIINGATVTGNTINGGAGYSAAALVGTAFKNVTATNVSVSDNTYTLNDDNSNYNTDGGDYGYIYKGAITYSVNGAVLA